MTPDTEYLTYRYLLSSGSRACTESLSRSSAQAPVMRFIQPRILDFAERASAQAPVMRFIQPRILEFAERACQDENQTWRPQQLRFTSRLKVRCF